MPSLDAEAVRAELERQRAIVAAEPEAQKRAEQLATITDLSLNGLRAKIRQAERLMQQSKDEGTGARRFWWVVAQQCKARLSTLAPESEGQKAARKNGGEAKLSPRKVGAAEQAALWDLTDQALDEQRATRTPEQPADMRNEAHTCSKHRTPLLSL